MNPYRDAQRTFEPREVSREPLPEWAALLLTVLGSVWVLVCLSAFAPGCGATLHDNAVLAANGAHAAGDEAADVLHTKCEVPYEGAAKLIEQGHVAQGQAKIERLETFCPRAAAAFDAWAAAHAALVSILVAEDAPEADVARLVADLEAAGIELARAIDAVLGGSR